MIALVVVGVLALGVVLIGVLGARLASAGRTAEPGYEQADQGRQPTGTRVTTTVDQPTTTVGETTTATTDPADGNTVQPPPQPQPVARLGDNPINRDGLGVPPVTCELPPFSQDLAGQDRFYRAAIPCLDAAWAPVLQAASLPFQPPNLQTVSGPVTTPCGSNNGATNTAWYCGATVTIYMSAGYYANVERLGNRSGSYLGVLAHEYGHHVQGVSGINRAYWDARYSAGPASPLGLELSRRSELQASCFAGMFVAGSAGRGSIDQNIANEMIDDLSHRGDDPPNTPRDHGTGANNAAWSNQGLRLNRTFQCNTWLAPPESVQ